MLPLHRHRSWELISLLFFGGLFLASAFLLAQDIPSGVDSNCPFEETRPPGTVRWVAASGEDLRVIVDWRDEPIAAWRAFIRVVDATGNQIVRRRITPVSGTTSDVLLPGALASVPLDGFQYEVTIENPRGRSLAPEHPFRVFLDCSQPLCVYEVANGIRTPSLVIRDELLDVLDQMEAVGSFDILGDALAARPDLAGQIYSLGWQLDQLDQSIPLDGPCSCLWMPAFGRTPEKTESAIHFEDPIEGPHVITYSYQDGAGYFFLTEAMGAGLKVPIAASGESRVVMDLRCWEFEDWQPVTIATALPSNPALQFRLPVASNCDEPCSDANVESTVELGGKLFVETMGSATGTAVASADADFDFQVDGNSLVSSVSAVAVASPPDGHAYDLACSEKSAGQSKNSRRVESVLTSATGLDILAGPEAGSQAESSLDFLIAVRGEAQCAIVPIIFFDMALRPGGLTSHFWPST